MLHSKLAGAENFAPVLASAENDAAFFDPGRPLRTANELSGDDEIAGSVGTADAKERASGDDIADHGIAGAKKQKKKEHWRHCA
jgi:hypothetical protein